MKSTEKLQNEETKTKQRTIKLPQVCVGGGGSENTSYLKML